MDSDNVKIEVITDLAAAPGWIDMKREYLNYAVAKHKEVTGQTVDAEDQLRQTVEHIDEFLGPKGRFIVARTAENELLGMVLLFRLANGKGEIKRLYVHPKARRKGLAKRLMEKLELEAKQMGCSALYLDTSAGLKEAIAFYRSLGFDDAPFDPTSVQSPEIAKYLVIMEKAL
ncbi:GNAT family N-acetyltransferase [Yoonia sediminilitoris]|uniref:Acetyltransferase (GNAT) family protein n=1 Tax=Yoonia sediminilitoris TaxID=1286148 RepID=A0A2T6KAQ6_9RHOB|nr:GNAT family N-acetyltransferase [Yoonia sediminilitoris]PUB11872.1 acetyltransferase (GNAT) family protein [Yoonia sediminilitoris]RCW91949.1 acetyltransferase (GNAT) family protein [Yoonia sediminilitoris]